MSTTHATTTTPIQKFNINYKRLTLLFIVLLTVSIAILYTYASAAITTNQSTSAVSSENISTLIISLLSVFAFIVVFFKFNLHAPSFRMVSVLFLYISGLIAFFRYTPRDFINSYAYIILPITLLIGCFLFYKIISEEGTLYEDILSNQIKYAVTYVLLISFIIIFYTTNPGHYITSYSGLAGIFTMLLSVFGLLYLFAILFYPQNAKVTTNKSASATSMNNMGFSLFGIIEGALFAAFLIAMVAIIYQFPGGFLNDSSNSITVLIMLIISVFILWFIYFVLSFFSPNGSVDKALKGIVIAKEFGSIGRVFKNSLLLFLGLLLIGILSYWLISTIQGLTSQNSIIYVFINLIVVICIFALIYKMAVMSGLYKTAGNSKIGSGLAAGFALIIGQIAGEINSFNDNSKYYVWLFVILVAIVIYFKIPAIKNWIMDNGGKLLVNNPVYTNKQYNLASYQILNGTEDPTYKYAVSFWTFINASSPNTSTSYDSYVSLFNYGDNPNISYNAHENTLMITMKNIPSSPTGNNADASKTKTYDEAGNHIIYKRTNILLQKWNHILINYNGGTLDIFYNGELVKSITGIIPYVNYDIMSIGVDNGIQGGLCNLNYFTKSLTSTQIYYLYNLLKDTTPPVITDNDKTIMDLSGYTYIPIQPTTSYVSADTKNMVIQSQPTQSQSNIITPPTPDLTPPTDADYLSLRWYFKNGNNDTISGL